MKIYFAKNLKYLRERKGLSQSELARITKKLCDNYNKEVSNNERITPITQASIARWEAEKNSPTVDNIVILGKALNVGLVDLIGEDLSLDNENNNNTQIPLFYNLNDLLKSKLQKRILEHIDLPNSWIKSNKEFFAFKISDDSMAPKYSENDIVIVEKKENYFPLSKEDCVILLNENNITFKCVIPNDKGITIVPLNINKIKDYVPTFYTKEQIENLSLKIIGVAKERRTRL